MRTVNPEANSVMRRWLGSSLIVLLSAASVLAVEEKIASAPKALAPAVRKPAPHERLLGKAKHIAVVPLRGQTDDVNYYSLKRRFQDAAARGADLIVLDINSPGGPVGSSIRIANLVASQKDPPVVIYVSEMAISGGAMAALACPTIFMHKRSQIGDIQPIMMAPSSEKKIIEAPEKFVSPIRATIESHAQENGYPVAICEAMVDPDIEALRLKLRDGRSMYIKGRERPHLETTDLWNQVVGEPELICPKGKLLTLTARNAKEYGIARQVVENLNEVTAMFRVSGAVVETLEPTNAETVVAFLNAQWLNSLLILVGLGSLYVAVKAPGFGVPETIAIVCFVLFFFSKAMVGKADVLEVSMFVVGLGLIVLEVFVIPGFGVVGVLGALMVFASLVLALQEFTFPRYAFQWEIGLSNVATVMGSALASFLLLVILLRFMPNTPFLRRLILTKSLAVAQGYVGASRKEKDLAGKEGVALTALRPSGKAEFDDEPVQVVTQGEMIEAGEPVVIIEARGNRITVARA